MSLDTVELIYEIEGYFGIRIADTDAEQIATVQDIVSSVCRLLGDVPEAPSAAYALVLGIIQREMQAVLSLPAPPANTETLARLRGTDEATWRPLLASLALRTGLQVSHLPAPAAPETSWLFRLLGRQPARWPDWTRATLGEFVGWLLSLNYQSIYQNQAFRSKYDVLRVVIGIVSYKSGVDVWEISPRDHITNDLGMD